MLQCDVASSNVDLIHLDAEPRVTQYSAESGPMQQASTIQGPRSGSSENVAAAAPSSDALSPH